MSSRSWSILLACCLLCLTPDFALADEAAESPKFSPEHLQFFEQSIRPLLAKHCWECHGREQQKSGLRLDFREAVLKGGESGEPAAVSGRPAESILIAALRSEGDYEMPPDEPLQPAEIALLEKWVRLGLPWTKVDPALLAPITMKEKAATALGEHWAFQPIHRPSPPQAHLKYKPQTPVDSFIAAGLASKGLTASPPADRRTLIRRATFDLLGLPPTWEQVRAFENDNSPDAYQRLIDSLLASPRYGERWGRHWLDVARYADTKGYAFARERRFPYAYTYRDYVIQAFNNDTPYDRFVTEQLAADQLDLSADNQPLAAMGFLTTGRRFNNAQDDIDDKIDVVTRGLLGLTVGCARCHDHKYDAIPTKDYYSLYGVFASTVEPAELPILGDPTQTPGYAAFKAELEKRQAARDAYVAQILKEYTESFRANAADYLVRATAKKISEAQIAKLPFIRLKREASKPRMVQRWRKYLTKNAQPDHPLFGPWVALFQLPPENFSAAAAKTLAALADPAAEKWKNVNPLVRAALLERPLESPIDVARRYGALFEQAYAKWKEHGAAPNSLEQLPQEWRQLAEVLVAPGGPTEITLADMPGYFSRDHRQQHGKLQRAIDKHVVDSPSAPPRAMVIADRPTPVAQHVFIRGNHARPGDAVPRQFLYLLAGEKRQPFQNGSGRLELAAAITAADNPLTARVLANRIWMHHFDQPLVATPSDFGILAPPPEQLDLLNYLAATLLENGWSIKRLHRQIMLSATYQQASADQAENRRQDPENRFYWRKGRRRLEFEALRDSLLAASGELDQKMAGRPEKIVAPGFSRRRTVYGEVDRQDLPNLFRAFDFASPDQSSPRRPETTVPQQALFLMNSKFVRDRATALAASTRNIQNASQRITALFRRVLAREPQEQEIKVLQDLLGVSEASDAANNTASPERWEQLAQLLLMSNEFMFVD